MACIAKLGRGPPIGGVTAQSFLPFARRRARVLLAAVVALLPSTQLSAQQRDSTTRDSSGLSLDSLAARLARTDAALRVLQQQLATESSTQVRLRSRIQLDLSARLIVNGSLTTGAVSNAEVPGFALPARIPNAIPGTTARVFGLSMRQSLLGASASVDSIAGATLVADFELDFFSRALDANPPLFPEPRLRTARVFLVWPRTELMLGTDTPLISDLNPISAAGVGIPVFAAAGNLWNWLPQLRVSRTVWSGPADWSLAVQGAVMSPNASDRAVANPQGADIGQASGRPAFESRLRLRRGEALDERPAQGVWSSGFELGIGAHRSWVRPGADTLLRSTAISADLRMSLGHGLELRGEAYQGRLLRGLGGAAIGQNFGTLGVPATETGVPLSNSAGWMQLNAQWHPSWITGLGCGTDRVHGSRADRRRNSACAAHASWRPVQPLLMTVEYRRFATRFADGLRRAGHWNIGFGIDL